MSRARAAALIAVLVLAVLPWVLARHQLSLLTDLLIFGLFALSGKATSFIGPALVGWITYAADSQRVGMGAIPVFFVLGMLLLLRVREPRV